MKLLKVDSDEKETKTISTIVANEATPSLSTFYESILRMKVTDLVWNLL